MSGRPEPFWMVKGAGPASCTHQSRRAAEMEADRLARLHPGHMFFVMEAVAMHRRVDVERVAFREDQREEIPF
ncbi:hypothetical protein [Paracoccus alcaliphilus]|nr:hypothetical protein [Paracoccus alcaliphilus]WCR17548.1 hypothetical protein JHW40_14605 [Paracoccus alcaliphilus]